MSRTTLARGTLAFLLVASLGAVQACSEEASAPAGSVSVSLEPTSSSIARGGSTTNAVTVLGGGGFVATPIITVTGAPAGITTSVSSVVTASGTSTATVTFTVSMTTTPGIYPMSIVASGQGVSARAAVYTLTVTGG
jgi:aminopeptidase S